MLTSRRRRAGRPGFTGGSADSPSGCGQDLIAETAHQASDHFDVLRFVVDNENLPGSRVTHRLLSLALEYFADFCSECFGSEWLVQERDPRLEDTVLDNGLFRVPRHVDHSESWVLLDQLPGQFRPARARHDDVSQEHVDRLIRLEELKSLVRVRSDEYGVAV